MKIIKKAARFCLILSLAVGWIFSGWPQIFNFPPEIQKAYAAACTTMTVGTGTDVAAATIAPESEIADRGVFTTLATNGTTCPNKTITAMTVTLASSGTPYLGLSEVRVTSSDGSTLYFNATSTFYSGSPNVVKLSGGTALPITLSTVTFKIRVTPRTHALMDAVPGASYTFNPLVSAVTTTLTPTVSDTNPNNTIIDNTSPVGATSPSISAGNAKVTLGWTSTNGETSTSTILRWAASSAGAEVPAEGATYAAGDAIAPTATVACVFKDLTTATVKSGIIDGSGGTAGCTTSALTNGQAYTYTVFQQDANGNYDAGTSIGSATPVTVPDAPTIGTATAGNAQASVTFTPPASDGGSAITGYTVTSSPGSFTGTGAGSPIIVTGLSNGTAYTFTVHATNAIGDSAESSASNSVTPSATVAPTVTTNFANAGFNSATLYGTKTGGDNATQHGFAYGTDSTLATVIATTTLGALTSDSSFSSGVGGLSVSITYYFRAYVTNAGGTGYGIIRSFVTGNSTATRNMRLFEGFTIKFFNGTIILHQQ